jgi:hypothetical protein
MQQHFDMPMVWLLLFLITRQAMLFDSLLREEHFSGLTFHRHNSNKA